MPKITVCNKHHGATGEYIGRGNPLGNPYPMFSPKDRDKVCDQFEEHIDKHIRAGTPSIINELVRLANIARERDLNLICFCAPKRCHGDTIKRLVEEIIS